jgi:hypothetical protein
VRWPHSTGSVTGSAASQESTKNLTGYGTTRVGDACIVDTGVFLRWFIDQPGSEHALQEIVDAYHQKRPSAALLAADRWTQVTNVDVTASDHRSPQDRP